MREDHGGEFVTRRFRRGRIKVTMPLKHPPDGCRAKADPPRPADGETIGVTVVEGVMHRLLSLGDVAELVRRRARYPRREQY